MNEQQTKEAAAIMQAAKWVDGKCVNVETRRLAGSSDFWLNGNPGWDWDNCDYRIAKPEQVRYYVWKNGGIFSNTAWCVLEDAKQTCRSGNCTHILKVTTKPDGTKTAEFIEV